MAGYSGRSSGAHGIHAPLKARAIAATDGTATVVVIVADLISLDADLLERIRGLVREQGGLEPDAVMIHCTHTHGGPYVKSFRCMGRRDEAYADVLTRKLAGIVRQALAELRPAVFTYGESACQIGVNRRRSTSAGVILDRDYAAPVAPIVQALCLQSPSGTTRALLFNHACHPTTQGGECMQFHGDWPGAAAAEAERRMREQSADGGFTPDALALCMSGCCGDINPVRRGSWEAVASNGQEVASAALSARWNAHGGAEQSVSWAEETVQLPLLPPPPADECRQRVRDAAAALTKERDSRAEAGRILLAEGLLQWAEDALAAAVHGPPAAQEVRTQRISLGPADFIGIPAEVFVQYQLDLSRRSPRPVIALGNTNGCWNYLPTAEEYARGGYEVDRAYQYYGTQMFAPESEKVVREACYRLLGIAGPVTAPLPGRRG